MRAGYHCYLLCFWTIFNQISYRYPDCSGQAAVITPRQVTSGLGARRVMAIAAAKHHTVIATEGGEVFTWGSNRGKNLTILLSISFAGLLECKFLHCILLNNLLLCIPALPFYLVYR